MPQIAAVKPVISPLPPPSPRGEGAPVRMLWAMLYPMTTPAVRKAGSGET